ncbi:hypothetical protein LZ32DRAFT_310968 [Colletotrichum eremochloae]|nr:hypothetical protein LZ32DRAFT_310968 [Colletotrichum eremochloae]
MLQYSICCTHSSTPIHTHISCLSLSLSLSPSLSVSLNQLVVNTVPRWFLSVLSRPSLPAIPLPLPPSSTIKFYRCRCRCPESYLDKPRLDSLCPPGRVCILDNYLPRLPRSPLSYPIFFFSKRPSFLANLQRSHPAFPFEIPFRLFFPRLPFVAFNSP